MTKSEVPIQAVEKPIICSPYDPPSAHWEYDRMTGEARKQPWRRPAKYWYKTKDDIKGQGQLELLKGQNNLVTVNQLREDVARWRESHYEGVTPITRELLRFWPSPERARRLFFCQREAVETVIFLAEIPQCGKRPRFKPQFPLSDLAKLVDQPANSDLLPLTRFGCKMATGSGKTVVMAMLISWAFCNRGRNPSDERPNLTTIERLQMLRPERPDKLLRGV